MPVMTTMGSSSVFNKAEFGIWLILPLAALILNRRAVLASGRGRVWLGRRELTGVVLGALAGLSISGGVYSWNYIYRDSSTRSDLTAQLAPRRLRWIFTTELRARSVNDLFDALSSHVQKNDRILAYSSIPMLYYATGTIPILKKNWLNIKNITRKEVEGIASALCRKEAKGAANVPVVIVRARMNARDGRWGLREDVFSINRPELVRIIDGAVARCRPIRIWANLDFELLKPTLRPTG